MKFVSPSDPTVPSVCFDAAQRCAELGLPAFTVCMPEPPRNKRYAIGDELVMRIGCCGKIAPVNLVQDRKFLVDMIIAQVRALSAS